MLHYKFTTMVVNSALCGTLLVDAIFFLANIGEFHTYTVRKFQSWWSEHVHFLFAYVMSLTSPLTKFHPFSLYRISSHPVKKKKKKKNAMHDWFEYTINAHGTCWIWYQNKVYSITIAIEWMYVTITIASISKTNFKHF